MVMEKLFIRTFLFVTLALLLIWMVGLLSGCTSNGFTEFNYDQRTGYARYKIEETSDGFAVLVDYDIYYPMNAFLQVDACRQQMVDVVRYHAEQVGKDVAPINAPDIQVDLRSGTLFASSYGCLVQYKAHWLGGEVSNAQ